VTNGRCTSPRTRPETTGAWRASSRRRHVTIVVSQVRLLHHWHQCGADASPTATVPARGRFTTKRHSALLERRQTASRSTARAMSFSTARLSPQHRSQRRWPASLPRERSVRFGPRLCHRGRRRRSDVRGWRHLDRAQLMKLRDASNVLKSVAAIHMRDAANVLRTVPAVHMRDAANVLKSAYSSGPPPAVSITPSSRSRQATRTSQHVRVSLRPSRRRRRRSSGASKPRQLHASVSSRDKARTRDDRSPRTTAAATRRRATARSGARR
jgi:hypothetical protein